MLSETFEWPAFRDPTQDQLILRDGSVAVVRPTVADDRAALQRFFHDLSPESRRNRFFINVEPQGPMLERFCDSTDPFKSVTLVALRHCGTAVQPVAVASYAATGHDSAEVAFAVSDGQQGKGLGTVLLERLAAIAGDHGFESLEATTLADNAAMLEVFRDSGFEMRSRTSQGVVEVRLSLRPTHSGVSTMDERNRAATVASMKSILEPESVAVIGVSRNPASMGRRLFDGLVGGGYKGAVYAVNPHATDVGGRQCYTSVLEVPRGVDLAVIVTPRDEVLRVIDECAAARVRSLVVITAGFAETGDEGRCIQQAALEKARAHGMRLVGPNCMGVLNGNPNVRLDASLADRLPAPGRLAIASQSGGVGLALLELAAARQLGISTFVSLGNKADVSSNDILQWAENDPQTSVLLLYLESFGNPRRFAQLSRRIGLKKPIIAVKAGRTAAGSRAAGSHTASMASSEAAVDALFKQCGIIRAGTIDEMFDIAQCLDLQPLPAGTRVGIISNAGGPGILAADACESAGLTVPPFSPDTQATLAGALSQNASVSNPIDLTASSEAGDFECAITTALASPDIDSLIVIYTPIDNSQTPAIVAGIGRGVAKARSGAGRGKPVLACTLSATTQSEPLPAGQEQVPAYMFPENAARALGHAAAYAQWRTRPAAHYPLFDDVRVAPARELCQHITASRGDTWLTGEELTRLLNTFGLRVVASTAARTEQGAVSVASIAGYPAVLKLDAPGLLHKSDIGAVRTRLPNADAVREAFRDMASRFPDAVRAGTGSTIQVQPMVEGIEILIGAADDARFGPVIAFGSGGVDAEVMRDVAFRVAPLSDRDADELMREVRGFHLLEGYRGRPAADVDALREILLRVSFLAHQVPELRELDLNPVIVLPKGRGCVIVDARARVAPR